MGPIRTTLVVTIAIATLLAGLAPREEALPERISARELLGLAQRSGERTYTYDRATAARLEAIQVERPAPAAGLAELETLLGAAGFALQPFGPPERRCVRVEAQG